MRGFVSYFAVAAVATLVGCAEADPVVESQAAEIVYGSSTTPVPTARVSWKYDELPSNFRFIPTSCQYFAVITYKLDSCNGFRAHGVCTRPGERVVWRIDGSKAQLGALQADVADAVATQSQVFPDFGAGGAGGFTKVGPKGGGGPGPTGDDVKEWVLDYARTLDAVEIAKVTEARATWPGGTPTYPGGACQIPTGPSLP